MNLKDQLQTMAKGKNASYSAIADYLLGRKSYAGLKLKEVALACHVSDATVVRFCQNLGFDGFSDLKYNLTNVLQQKWRQFETDLQSLPGKSCIFSAGGRILPGYRATFYPRKTRTISLHAG